MPRSYSLILQPARFRELTHHALLLLGKLFRGFDSDLDDQIALLVCFLNSLASDAKTFARRGARRNLDQNFFPVESLDADLRAKRRLRNVDRNCRDNIQSIALIKLVRLDIERD